MEKEIELSHFAVVKINEDGSGSIHGSIIDDRPENWEEDSFHFAIDNIFSLVLFHALSGVDVGSDEYVRGFEQQMTSLAESFTEDG